jgi:demethylmenaquinone methyltransferase / 2-methoxy-6-polyprenyl-1,4-benzoquinol methylase
MNGGVMSATGPGTSEKARQVREMFGAIAGRYDFLNHFLSGNIDRRWRKICVREVARRLTVSKPHILDVGCGTADLSLAFSPLGPVTGCDFSHPMLQIGAAKAAIGQHPHPVALLEGDALALPFAGERFDAVVSAFVLRNLADAGEGLVEMRRVMRPGGVLGVMDFCMPSTPLLGKLYRAYFLGVLPKIGTWVSGVEGPYKYLPESVQTFPGPEELKELIIRAGFVEVEIRLLTGGIAVLLLARTARD